MTRLIFFVVLLNYLSIYQICSLKLPGPQVFVVTPSPKQQGDARAAPFYYQNWRRRIDTPQSASTTTTTEKIKTPDLIFAEFESNDKNMKSIRKLLEKEKIESKTTESVQPIYVPDEEKSGEVSNSGLRDSSTEKLKETDMTDYFAYYNNLYNSASEHVPPKPSSSFSLSTTVAPSTTTTTTPSPMNNIENIWHIIDNQKHHEISNTWEEEPISSEQGVKDVKSGSNLQTEVDKANEIKNVNAEIDENFALPGFGSNNPGHGGENESRAIHTENNFRFPYVDLKPFQMKNTKKSQYSYSNKMKGSNNMFNLDSFTEIKNPVRGEVQDSVPMREPIDRFNPAQPYLPQTYGSNSKQATSDSSVLSAAPAPPVRTVANLVPPPPPIRDSNDFPTPSTYESFPPYPPSAPATKPVSSYQPPAPPHFKSPPVSAPDSGDSSENDGPPVDLGYRYKPPAPAPASRPFVPTLVPPSQSKPFPGYSYDKPPSPQDDAGPPMMDLPSKPDFHGYHYSKPAMAPPSQDYPSDIPPSPQDDADDTPPMMDLPSKPDFHGYHYSKPAMAPPSQDYPSDISPSPQEQPTYGNHDAPPPNYKPEFDFPELVFDKPHGGKDIDFKYHHDHDDFNDHDHDHYHHHPPTTTTTEMPRVNRYSYYYLGKKLYYLPLYFSVYFIVYVGALIIKAVLRHKIVYPNSWRPNDQTASFFSKRSIDSHLSNENLHEITGRVTRAIASAAEKYMYDKSIEQ